MHSEVSFPSSNFVRRPFGVSLSFPSISRHRSFKGATVGKAAVMSMCGRKSGGVVQVKLGTIASLSFSIIARMAFLLPINLH